MRYFSKYKNRKTIDKEDHEMMIRLIMGTVTLIFLLLLVGIGWVVRSTEMIWPVPMGAVQVVKQAYAVEKPVYVVPETIEDKIRTTFKEDPETAVRIAKCESGLNPKAKNKTSSARGLFQVMQSWHRINEKWLLNEDINIQVAYQLWQEQGWNPWEASRHCWGSK